MSDNPDGLSQSISSIRELLTAILHRLTEGETFDDDEFVDGRPTRRARIKHILYRDKGLSRDSDVANSVADTLVASANLLSARYHPTTPKDREQIHFDFKSAEYLIFYIILQS